MRILVTRPLREGQATARRLLALGHEPLLAPVLEIAGLEAHIPDGPFDAWLATSINAFLTPKPQPGASLHVAGAQTARAAKAAGWPAPATVAADARALVAALLQAYPSKAGFLYLAGRDRKSDVETLLRGAGHAVTVAETYAAEAASAFPPPVLAALADGTLHATLHYSRRSAGMFIALAQASGLAAQAAALLHLCLSHDVAAPLARLGATRILCATAPDEASLLDLLGRP